MPSEQSKEKEKSNNRWWEFYLVRYFVGTVFGTLISLYLYSTKFSSFYNVTVSLKDITNSQLIFFGLIGLAYCYVASAPILVLHAVRSSIYGKGTLAARFAAVSILSATVIFCFLIKDHISRILLGGVISLQFTLYCFAITKNRIFEFYRELITGRIRGIDLQKNKITDYVESYRHLREHGNAFLILIFEFVLGLILYQYNDIEHVVLTCILWLLPASCVWFVGSYLESNIKKIH